MKEDSESLIVKEGLKIAVFGAGGAVGMILVGFLQKMGDVSQITCVDRDLGRMYKFLNNRQKLIHFITDINTNGNGNLDEKLIRTLKNHLLFINATSPKHNRKIMMAALTVGANYLDFASLDDKIAEQKTFHDRFQENDLVAWINEGVGPGSTNLLAAKLMNGLRDCVVRIRVAESTKVKLDKNGKRPLIFFWNPELTINEVTSPVYDSRQDIVREPFSSPESCIFPYPIGKITCRHMNENEVISMKESFSQEILREITVKSGGEDNEQLFKELPKIKKLQAKNQLESFTKKLKTISPKDVEIMLKNGTILDGRVAIVIEVDGEEPETEERVLRRATWMGLGIREVPAGTTHISFNTAIVAFCAIEQMIAAKELKAGVWAPEEIPEKTRELILQCVERKTNPIHIQTY